MFDYRVAKRRNGKGWDVLRQCAAGKLYNVSPKDKLTRKEAVAIARLLAGHGSCIMVHDKHYPVALVFPQSPFATTHI